MQKANGRAGRSLVNSTVLNGISCSLKSGPLFVTLCYLDKMALWYQKHCCVMTAMQKNYSRLVKVSRGGGGCMKNLAQASKKLFLPIKCAIMRKMLCWLWYLSSYSSVKSSGERFGVISVSEKLIWWLGKCPAHSKMAVVFSHATWANQIGCPDSFWLKFPQLCPRVEYLLSLCSARPRSHPKVTLEKRLAIYLP